MAQPAKIVSVVLSSLLLIALLASKAAYADEVNNGEVGEAANLDTMNTATVAEILTELKKDPARIFAEHSGWIVAEKSISGGAELWSFTPLGHDAYPAAVQRLITDADQGQGLAIEMNIQCDATPEACQSLENLFSVMNENLVAVSKEAPPIREPDIE